MDDDRSSLEPQTGTTIVGSDGEEVGKIDIVEANYVIVRKGLFPQDYYIPVSDIVSRDRDGRLQLAIPAQQALDRGLGNPMVAAEAVAPAIDSDDERIGVTASRAGEVIVEDVGLPRDDTVDAGIADAPDHASEAINADAGAPVVGGGTERDRDDMHRTISLSEEEVTATTRPVERGVVRIEKKVIEERQTLEVPLVEEEVHVTRRRVDRDIADDDAPFEEKHIELPLRGQGVEIEKQAHVVEEVEIGKTAHQRIETIHETVRREKARIETGDAGAVDEPVTRLDEDETATT